VRSDGLRNAIKNISIGDIRPREENKEEDGPSIFIRIDPSTSTSNAQAQEANQDVHDDGSQAQEQLGSSTPLPTSTQDPLAQPRIHHAIAKDHTMD
jgi:hypothetical protein